MKKKTIDGLHALLKDGQVDQRDAILHMVNETEADVARLQHSVTDLETRLERHQKPGKATNRILASPEIKELQAMLAKAPSGMDDRQWAMTKGVVDKALPDFEEAIMRLYPGMKTDDMKICYLTRSQFRTSDIATLLDMKWSTVSTKKKRLCSRLFPDITATAKGFEGGIMSLP
ncbi:MAG: hypothetical protein K5893_02985 [Prevotella sp.]|nr:hypothetical protein [Prevotella sp.]